MRSGRGSWWWAQIMRVLVYGALGILSVGLAIWVDSMYPPPPIRALILLVTWTLGMLLIDIRVRSEPVEEEDP